MNWNEFWQSHGRQNYTPAFNTLLESLIADPRAPIFCRVLAWVLRNSWGRHSNAVVDESGIRQGQVDCARDLKLLDKHGQPDRRKVNHVFQRWARLKVVSFDGREIVPNDNPLGLEVGFAQYSPFSDPIWTKGEETVRWTVSLYIEKVWSVAKPLEYAEYQKAEHHYKELRTDLINDYKAYTEMSERGPTSEAACPNGVRQDVGLGDDTASERGTTIASPSLNKNEEPFLNGASSSFSIVRTELERHGNVDDDVLFRLVKSCQQKAPDCTPEEINHFIGEKARLISPRTRNSIGFLLSAVPKCFEGGSFKAFRRQQDATQRLKAEERQREHAEAERLLQELRQQLEDPNTPEDDKAFIRQAWPELEATPERKPAQQEPSTKAQKAGQG